MPILPVGQVEVAVEHGPGLQVVEVVVGDPPERIESAGPQVPQQPEQERHAHDGDADDHGDGESSAAQLGLRAADHRLPEAGARPIDSASSCVPRDAACGDATSPLDASSPEPVAEAEDLARRLVGDAQVAAWPSRRPGASACRRRS